MSDGGTMICPVCKGKKKLPVCTVCDYTIEDGDCICVDTGGKPSPGEPADCPECLGTGRVEDEDDLDEDFEEADYYDDDDDDLDDDLDDDDLDDDDDDEP